MTNPTVLAIRELEISPNPTKAEVDQFISMLRETSALPEVSKVERKVKTLAQKASEVLGYNALLSKTGSGILMRTLVDLEIEVLDRFAVFEYQKKFGLPMINPHKERSVASRSQTGFLVDAVRSDQDDLNIMEEGHTLMPARWTSGDVWGRTALRYYSDEIPEFVLNKAIQIKEALPTAGVYVEHLIHQPDPFLIVSYGGEEFYVEVWAEPGFEGRVTKDETSGSSRRSKRNRR